MASPNDQAIAKAACITASIFLAGQNAYIVYGAIPAIVHHQTSGLIAARQWKTVCAAGHAVGPVCGILGSLAAGYLAAQHRSSNNLFKIYAASALLQFTIVPWSIFAVLPVEAKLEKIVDSGKDEKKDEVIGLIRNWTKRHAVRIVFTAMGGFLTLWAAVSD